MKKLAVVLVSVLLFVAAFSLAACYDKYEPAVWFKPTFYYGERESKIEYAFPVEIVFDDKTDKIEITVDYLTEYVWFGEGLIRVPGDPRYNSWFTPAGSGGAGEPIRVTYTAYRYIERYGNVPDPYSEIDTPGQYIRKISVWGENEFPDRELTLIINVKATK